MDPNVWRHGEALSGKQMEPPVKQRLVGAEPDKVFNRDAKARAQAKDWFIGFAQRRPAAR